MKDQNDTRLLDESYPTLKVYVDRIVKQTGLTRMQAWLLVRKWTRC